MPLIYNGVEVPETSGEFVYNGITIEELIYNGITVYSISAIPLSYFIDYTGWDTTTNIDNTRSIVNVGSSGTNLSLQSGSGISTMVDQYVPFDDIVLTSDFTVSYISKFSDSTTYEAVVANDTLADLLVILNPTTLAVRFGNGGYKQFTINQTLIVGNIYSFDWVRVDGNIEIYIDNVLDTTITYSSTAIATFNALHRWAGYYNDTISKDIYIFNRGLSQEELTKKRLYPEDFFFDVKNNVITDCVLNMPLNETYNTCRDYVSGLDYTISNYLDSVRDDAQNIPYGLQNGKLVRDTNGIISAKSDYLEGDGISTSTIPASARNTDIDLIVYPTALTGNVLSGGVILSASGLTLNQDNIITLSNQSITDAIVFGDGFTGTIKEYKETEL